MSHSPTPFAADFDSDDALADVMDANGSTTAVFYVAFEDKTQDLAKGNVRLFLAAPDLLAACKAVFTTMDSDHPHFAQMRDAISKANITK